MSDPRNWLRFRPGASVSPVVGLVCTCALLLLPAAAAFAQMAITTSGTGQYLYNSNLYALQRGYPVPGTEDFQRADSYFAYGGELDLSELWRQQNWYATLSTSEYVFDRFTELNHDEYRLDGGWKWLLARNLTGTLEVLRSRTMVPFAFLDQSQLSLKVEQRETATAKYRFLPRWSIEGSVYRLEYLEPLVAEPNLTLSESSAGATLNYLGSADLTFGVNATYSHGSFSHAIETLNPAYDQRTVALVANYAPSTATTFSGSVGYTNRTSFADLDNVRGVTGHLSYSGQLTGKTSVVVSLDRTINAYLLNVGSYLDSTASTSLVWQATYRIGVNAGYSWSYFIFPDQGYVSGTERIDHLQFTFLNITYTRDWLILKPYVNLQTRSSDYPGYNFNATSYGIQFTLRWQKG